MNGPHWVTEFEQRVTLQTTLGIARLGGHTFGPGDAEALRRDAMTVCESMNQMVGMERAGDPACKVTSAQFDGAVVRILGETVCLVMSGALDRLFPREGVAGDD